MIESQDAPAWETSKENVVPIKRGRSAKGLSESLLRPLTTHAGPSEQRTPEQDFEDQLNDATITDGSQKLDIYVRYLKWLRDAYPSNSEKALVLLEVRVHQHNC
jgi:hypothetical protein